MEHGNIASFANPVKYPQDIQRDKKSEPSILPALGLCRPHQILEESHTRNTGEGSFRIMNIRRVDGFASLGNSMIAVWPQCSSISRAQREETKLRPTMVVKVQSSP
jgi:hypothetical protein